jgi:hypothetical protein
MSIVSMVVSPTYIYIVIAAGISGPPAVPELDSYLIR